MSMSTLAQPRNNFAFIFTLRIDRVLSFEYVLQWGLPRGDYWISFNRLRGSADPNEGRSS